MAKIKIKYSVNLIRNVQNLYEENYKHSWRYKIKQLERWSMFIGKLNIIKILVLSMFI